MKVIFFGTPDFAAKTLKYLLDHGVNIVAVVTKPDKPKGRHGHPLPTPVKEITLAQNPPLPLYQPPKASSADFAETLKKYDADLFVVVAYGEIMRQHLLDMPKKGCINVHASLLPKYRGAAPIERSIINGDHETGITIMHMILKLDAGNMIKTRKVTIGENTTAGELRDQLCKVGSELLLEVIHDFENGNVNSTVQDDSQATIANKIELDDCQINWPMPAQQIHNLIRGVTPHPGAWCYASVRGEKKRIKIIKSEVVHGHTEVPGQILSYDKNGIVVASGLEAIKILELQLEGKKALSADEFVRGLKQNQLFFIIS
jgi:methionyl-tRNA formyltransferase